MKRVSDGRALERLVATGPPRPSGTASGGGEIRRPDQKGLDATGRVIRRTIHRR